MSLPHTRTTLDTNGVGDSTGRRALLVLRGRRPPSGRPVGGGSHTQKVTLIAPPALCISTSSSRVHLASVYAGRVLNLSLTGLREKNDVAYGYK